MVSSIFRDKRPQTSRRLSPPWIIALSHSYTVIIIKILSKYIIISQLIDLHSKSTKIPIRAFLYVRTNYTHRKLVFIYIKNIVFFNLLVNISLFTFYLMIAPTIFHITICYDFQRCYTGLEKIVTELEIPNKIFSRSWNSVDFTVIG